MTCRKASISDLSLRSIPRPWASIRIATGSAWCSCRPATATRTWCRSSRQHLGGHGYDCPNLSRLLGDPAIVKLMHFARFDVADAAAVPGHHGRAGALHQDRRPADPHLHRPPRAQGSLQGTARRRPVEAAADLGLGRGRADAEQLAYAASDVLHLHALWAQAGGAAGPRRTPATWRRPASSSCRRVPGSICWATSSLTFLPIDLPQSRQSGMILVRMQPVLVDPPAAGDRSKTGPHDRCLHVASSRSGTTSTWPARCCAPRRPVCRRWRPGSTGSFAARSSCWPGHRARGGVRHGQVRPGGAQDRRHAGLDRHAGPVRPSGRGVARRPGHDRRRATRCWPCRTPAKPPNSPIWSPMPGASACRWSRSPRAPTRRWPSAADVALMLPAAAEACPMGLAPTTSTTMQMALGDALAVALLTRRGFTAADFQQIPSGRPARRPAAAGARPDAQRAMPCRSRRPTRRWTGRCC